MCALFSPGNHEADLAQGLYHVTVTAAAILAPVKDTAAVFRLKRNFTQVANRPDMIEALTGARFFVQHMIIT